MSIKVSCDHACGPSDYTPGGKCQRLGCYPQWNMSDLDYKCLDVWHEGFPDGHTMIKYQHLGRVWHRRLTIKDLRDIVGFDEGRRIISARLIEAKGNFARVLFAIDDEELTVDTTTKELNLENLCD